MPQVCLQFVIEVFPDHTYYFCNMVNVLYILNTFLFLFSNKLLVTRAGIHKMLVRIANMEDPSEEAV